MCDSVNSRAFLFSFILYLIFCEATHGANYQSPFCVNSTQIPCPENLIAPGVACELSRHKEKCEDFKFDAPTDSFPAKVSLSTYNFKGHYVTYPNLNISISDINFTNLLVRLHVENTTSRECLYFSVKADSSIPSMATLFYDCKWFGKRVSTLYMTAELRAQLHDSSYKYQKFYFRLPQEDGETSEDLQLFIYSETRPQCAKFHWACPPAKFNVSQYSVSLVEHHNNRAILEDEINTTETSMEFCKTKRFNTNYSMTVKPLLCNETKCDWGPVSNSTSFVPSPAVTSGPPLVEVALIILLCVLGLLIIWHIIIVYYPIKNTQPRCFLVYDPVSRHHLDVTNKLVSFLRGLDVNLLYGETDIGREEDVSGWWSKELAHADMVLIVSNPKCNEKSRTASIYGPFFEKGSVEFLLQNLISSSSSSKSFIRIMLPYCDEKDFFDCTKIYKCYHLLKDRFHLLHQIQGPHYVCLPGLISKLLYSEVFDSEKWTNLKQIASPNYDACHNEEAMNEEKISANQLDPLISAEDDIETDGEKEERPDKLGGNQDNISITGSEASTEHVNGCGMEPQPPLNDATINIIDEDHIKKNHILMARMTEFL